MSVEHWSDQELIDEMLDAESGLSEWEMNFADSCDRYIKEHSNLTPKQRNIARQVARRLTE